MRLNSWIALVASTFLVACGADSVADDYLKKTPKVATGDVKPDDKKPADKPTEPPTDKPTEPPVASLGDVAKGEEILKSCVSCHQAGSLAAKVTLDKTAVSRLDTAYTGKETAYHMPFSDAFEGEGRKDLEAALNAK